MVWIFLNRLAFYWSKNGKSPPNEKELMNDPETMSFAAELSKLCFNLLTSDQVVATAVVDVEPDMDSSSISLSFEPYDVIIPKQRLENFDLAILTERGPYTNDVGNFMECSFVDKQMVEFLACIHLHAEEEDLNDIAKTKSIRMLPLVCGISSSDKGEGQKIVNKFIKEVGTESSDRNAEFYLKYLHGMFLESPITFLHCIHEARMKKVHLLPPPNEKQIYIVQTKMAIHDIVALTYYLDNYDKSRINPEALVFSSQIRESKGGVVLKTLDISSSNLTDESLQQIAKLAFLVENIDLHNSSFGPDGVTMLVKCFHRFEGGDLKP